MKVECLIINVAILLVIIFSSCTKRKVESVSYTHEKPTVQDSKTNEIFRMEEHPMQKIKTHLSGTWDPGLTESEKATLFQIAEDTLLWCTSGSRSPFSFEKYNLTDTLKKRFGTFVTLKINNDLRGCIGTLEAIEELYKSVHHNTINAALRDWRFSPVTSEELPHIKIHISILSPIKDINSIDEFILGEHGIILIKGPFHAVFLPEVAVEQKWTKEQTLNHLSLKAGMRPNDWQVGARFKVFSSAVLEKE